MPTNRYLKLTLPLRLRVGKTKKCKEYALNLNIYRNMHYLVLSAMKIKFAEMVKDLLGSVSSPTVLMFKKPYVRYNFYTGSRRTTDMMNWVAVIDKFLMDALVEHNVIRDDNVEVIHDVHIKYKGMDLGKERLEIELEEDYE